MKMRVKRLTSTATLPMYAHEDDAGLDLYADKEVTLLPGERLQIPTGIALAVPLGHVGLIWDKSGLSHRRGLKTLGGVIDAGYRGEVLVGMVNLGTEAHTFHVGDKVAQVIIQLVAHPVLEEVDIFEETERGDKGFGSSGV